jgi:hypothetical protein
MWGRCYLAGLISGCLRISPTISPLSFFKWSPALQAGRWRVTAPFHFVIANTRQGVWQSRQGKCKSGIGPPQNTFLCDGAMYSGWMGLSMFWTLTIHSTLPLPLTGVRGFSCLKAEEVTPTSYTVAIGTKGKAKQSQRFRRRRCCPVRRASRAHGMMRLPRPSPTVSQ